MAGIKTKTYKYAEAQAFIDRVQANTDQYYIFAGHPLPWSDDRFPPAVFESIDDSVYQTQEQMILGSRISVANIRPMTKRYNWTSNTVYDRYSNADTMLFDKQFYVVTDENKVYKVLSNNLGKPSLYKPTLTQNIAFKTSDDYIWKYMYTVPPTDATKFASASYIPVVPDPTIQSAATTGIEFIEQVSSGLNYLTYVTGTIQSVLSANCFQIDSYASQDNDFYVRSSLYVTAGPAAGSLVPITRYISNTSGNFVFVKNQIGSIAPVISKYKISPTIQIVGDGSGATAVCDVSNNYGISNVTVIATGSGYTRAYVNVLANTSYGSSANLVPYVPPPGGHGANPIYELGCDSIMISKTLANNQSNTIPTEMAYRRYGVIRNPNSYAGNTVYSANSFSNVVKIVTSPATIFGISEKLQGDESGAQGYVAFSNSTITFMVGDKDFNIGENIRSLSSNVVTGISNITTHGDIAAGSSDVLYLNNCSPVPRSNTTSETIKIVYTF